MQINLSGHHLDITDAIRNHVHEKFARLERHSDQIINIHVIRRCTLGAPNSSPTLRKRISTLQSTSSWISSIDSCLSKRRRPLIGLIEGLVETEENPWAPSARSVRLRAVDVVRINR